MVIRALVSMAEGIVCGLKKGKPGGNVPIAGIPAVKLYERIGFFGIQLKLCYGSGDIPCNIGWTRVVVVVAVIDAVCFQITSLGENPFVRKHARIGNYR